MWGLQTSLKKPAAKLEGTNLYVLLEAVNS